MATSAVLPRHQCMIYDGSPTRQLPGLASMMVKQMAANKRCLYLNSPETVVGMRSALSAAGVDVAHEVERGALILTSDQSHLAGGDFRVPPMIAMLKNAVADAIRDGFAGLWASGDMAWEFGSEKNLMKLLEYECELEELFRVEPALSGVCQYHRETLPLVAIQEAIATHRAIYINDAHSRMNPYFDSEAGRGVLRPPVPDGQVNEMVAQLYAVAG